MKIVAACLLSSLGGKACPTLDDIKKNLRSGPFSRHFFHNGSLIDEDII
ncbi:hypothetical protein SOVF_183370 [Spinacia oleracea]|nr:hypothetical protein SOVF_183370 [Spinacia oleracea]